MTLHIGSKKPDVLYAIRANNLGIDNTYFGSIS